MILNPDYLLYAILFVQLCLIVLAFLGFWGTWRLFGEIKTELQVVYDMINSRLTQLINVVSDERFAAGITSEIDRRNLEERENRENG